MEKEEKKNRKEGTVFFQTRAVANTSIIPEMLKAIGKQMKTLAVLYIDLVKNRKKEGENKKA